MSDITDQEVLDTLTSLEQDIVNAYRRGYEDCEAKQLTTGRVWLTRDEAKEIRHRLDESPDSSYANLVLVALLDERINGG